MKTILGFLAAKFGFSCSGSSSRKFIDGYMLGAGITIKEYHCVSRAFGKKKYLIGFRLLTRKDLKFGFHQMEYSACGFKALCFGYGAIILSYKK